MAKSTFNQISKSLRKIKWQESYASFILGAIIVIVLGLLIANFFSKRGQKIDMGQATTQTEEQAKAGAEQEYKIVAGDSLSKIAEKFYDSQEFWPILARENNIVNPNFIFVDATLKIPAKSDAEKSKASMATTSYKVQSGDTLFLIAEKVYGDGSKWTILDRANKAGRLPNGNPLIFTDSTLIIPR